MPNCFIAIVTCRCLFIYKYFKNNCKKVLLIQILVVYLYSKIKQIEIMTAIGQLKSKVTLNCEICGCKTKRTVIANIFENTEEDKERAKNEIILKAKKKYTCRICKSIENAVR